MAAITNVKNRILELLELDYPTNKIAKIVGCSPATVSVHKKRNGFKMPEKKEFNFSEIQAYYDAGHTYEETCRACKVSGRTLEKAIARGEFKSRTASEAQKLSLKLKRRVIKHSEKTKKNLSRIRKKYLKENPEKHPQRILSYKKDKWTYPEKLFANKLEENKFVNGVDFEYNKRILNYYPDFTFESKKLIVEIDGEWFHKDKEKDLIRQKKIEDLGYIVIRFTAKEINSNVSNCLIGEPEALNLMILVRVQVPDPIQPVPECLWVRLQSEINVS